jgi:hypothetical protein
MTSERTKAPARPRRPDLKLVTRIALGLGLFVALIVAAIVLGAQH